MLITDMIVDRCNVADRYPEVLRYVISRMREGKRSWRSLERNVRREYLKAIIGRHKINRELYRRVMG